jgi:hypothetical protein
MWWPFKPKHKTIERNRLRLLLFKAFNGLDHKPLDMKYKMFNNHSDVVRRTPRLGQYDADFYDCDDRALDMMQKNHGFAIGMIRIKWNDTIDHVLNIVVIAGDLELYDPAGKKFFNTDNRECKDIWI